nr:helix-turn-helix domain-containing protein [Streptomyces meridianus]
MRCIQLGPVAVWPATFRPVTWRRTPKLIRQSDPETYHISLVLQGTGVVSWGGHQRSLGPYDLHNNHSSRPYDIWSDGSGPERLLRTIGVEVPKSVLPLPRGRAERVVGLPMSGREGIGALLTQFLLRLAADAGTYQPGDAPRLGTVLTDLFAAVWAQTLEAEGCLQPESRHRTLLLRMKAFVQQNLHDPALSPSTVAAAHHISLSYLHRIFHEDGVTVAAWIRTRRLERICHDLANVDLLAVPIHAVAARWGFPRPAEFSRAFRAAYGIAPRDYRHQVLRAGALPAAVNRGSDDGGSPTQ